MFYQVTLRIKGSTSALETAECTDDEIAQCVNVRKNWRENRGNRFWRSSNRVNRCLSFNRMDDLGRNL